MAKLPRTDGTGAEEKTTPSRALPDFSKSSYEMGHPYDLFIWHEEDRNASKFTKREPQSFWKLNPAYLPDSMRASNLGRRVSNLNALARNEYPKFPSWLDHFQSEDEHWRLKVLAKEFRRLAELIEVKVGQPLGRPGDDRVDRVYELRVRQKLTYKEIWTKLPIDDPDERDRLRNAVRKRIHRARSKKKP